MIGALAFSPGAKEEVLRTHVLTPLASTEKLRSAMSADVAPLPSGTLLVGWRQVGHGKSHPSFSLSATVIDPFFFPILFVSYAVLLH